MTYNAIVFGILSGLTAKIDSELMLRHYKNFLDEYEALGAGNFNVLVQHNAKELKNRLAGIKF